VTGQRIGFATARDGVRVAYAVSGRGPVLVIPPHWLSHLELDSRSPVRRHWIESLSANHTVIRYDLRGTGLSDRDVPAQSFDLWLDDLATVLDAAGVGAPALLGVCQGGPIAVAFAARYPERVRSLVLYGTYARCGPLGTRPAAEAGMVDTMLRAGSSVPATLHEVFARLLLPDAAATAVAAFVQLQRASVEPSAAQRINAVHAAVDVTADAPRVTAPTLVLHLRDDVFVPFEQGRILAALIPGSRFVPLPGRNHVLLPDDPAWTQLLSEIHGFLISTPKPTTEVALTNREREILTLVARGHGNDDIAQRLVLSVRTVERHLSNIYAKLGISGRTARTVAAIHATQHPHTLDHPAMVNAPQSI
jgi:pimeloyl-ACP methyl ester carboxylesterase/DNA-binding CsgD family transcriptional regulator